MGGYDVFDDLRRKTGAVILADGERVVFGEEIVQLRLIFHQAFRAGISAQHPGHLAGDP